MAIYRQVYMSFWTDTKVIDDFTPEDRYFYLYLCTNPHTNIIGCYELGMTNATVQTGYTKETISKLLERFESVHKVIKYCPDTKEILLLNWHKYNWTKSDKLDKPILSAIEKVKNPDFKAYLGDLYNERDTVSIPYEYPMDTTVTVYTVSDTVSVSDSVTEIIDYLNYKTNKKYTYSNKSYNRLITARLKEKYTVEDFKTVIDKKCNEWMGTEYEQYLKPTTLFAPSHFEDYLNQTTVKAKPSVANRVSDVDGWI